MDILEAALAYALRGWPVFPCRPRSKQPLTQTGFKEATTDPEVIRAWWRKWPDANVAIATGTQSFDVLDVDPPKGGEQSVAELEARHRDLPAGPRQRTGNGRQLWFQGGGLGPCRVEFLPGLDIRGAGGYVVVAPSIHPNGLAYVLEDEDEPFPAPPEWLLFEIAGKGMARELPEMGPPLTLDDETATALLRMAGIPLRVIPQGQRNDRLFKFGASLRARGCDGGMILATLRLVSEHLCRPPVAGDEILRIAGSAASYRVSPHYERMQEDAEKEGRKAEADHSEQAVRHASDADVILETISKRLRVPVTGLRRIGTEKPRYALLIGGHEVLFSGMSALLTLGAVRIALADHSGIVLPRLKATEWDGIVAALLRIVEAVELPEAELSEETRRWIDGYLEAQNFAPGGPADALPDRLPIAKDGAVYFNAPALALWLSVRGVERIGVRELVVRLRAIGCEPAFFSARCEEKVIGARYWSIGTSAP